MNNVWIGCNEKLCSIIIGWRSLLARFLNSFFFPSAIIYQVACVPIIYLLTSVRQRRHVQVSYDYAMQYYNLTYTNKANIDENENRDVRVGSTYKRQLRNFIIQASYTNLFKHIQIVYGPKRTSSDSSWPGTIVSSKIIQIRIRVYKFHRNCTRFAPSVLLVHRWIGQKWSASTSPVADYFRNFKNIGMTSRTDAVIGGMRYLCEVYSRSSQNPFNTWNLSTLVTYIDFNF